MGKPHCENCFNPETWEFNQGIKYDTKYFLRIQDKVNNFRRLIKNIMIFGGEPLDSDISELLFELYTLKLPIWIFTHYQLKDVPNYVKNYCTYIKTGRYLPEKICDSNIQYGIKLATSNQRIYKKGIDF